MIPEESPSPASSLPDCFGDLKIVFPMGADGLRQSPARCLACRDKTACLKEAMKGTGRFEIQEELIDRAYEAGVIGFLNRWSKKKSLSLERENESTFLRRFRRKDNTS